MREVGPTGRRATVRRTSTRAGKGETAKGREVLQSCTFSLGSPPPPPPLRLAFNLAALSPRRATAVPKYGCHQRRDNLDSAARLSSGLVSLQPPLLSDNVLGVDEDSRYMLASRSLLFFLNIPQPQRERVLLLLYHL